MSNDNFSLPGDDSGPGPDADGIPPFQLPSSGSDQAAPGEPGGNNPSGEINNRDEEDSFLEDAGDIALKTGDVVVEGAGKVGKWGLVRLGQILRVVYDYAILIFFPIPANVGLPFLKRKDDPNKSLGRKILEFQFAFARKTLAYTPNNPNGSEEDLAFFSQPNLVVTIHLVWVGWLVALCELYKGALPEWVIEGVIWFWLFVLCVTIIAMGVTFGRVASFLLGGTIAIFVMGVVIWEQLGEVEIFLPLQQQLSEIDIHVGWGIPMVVSAVLGLSIMASTIWQRLDDKWTVEACGNYLEHMNFQQKDKAIAKAFNTFQQDWPCLLRKFLLFGFGNIIVSDSRGDRVVERIEGVFWAHAVSGFIVDRFREHDVREVGHEDGSFIRPADEGDDGV